MNYAVPETALAQELEPHVAADRERVFAAAHPGWHDEQMTLVDQPSVERLSREIGTAPCAPPRPQTVEVSVLICDVAVERNDGGEDQLP